MGLERHGNKWKMISKFFVKTRTPVQIASHAQKFFLHCRKTDDENRSKRPRGSIFDNTYSYNSQKSYNSSYSPPLPSPLPPLPSQLPPLLPQPLPLSPQLPPPLSPPPSPLLSQLHPLLLQLPTLSSPLSPLPFSSEVMEGMEWALK